MSCDSSLAHSWVTGESFRISLILVWKETTPYVVCTMQLLLRQCASRSNRIFVRPLVILLWHWSTWPLKEFLKSSGMVCAANHDQKLKQIATRIKYVIFFKWFLWKKIYSILVLLFCFNPYNILFFGFYICNILTCE